MSSGASFFHPHLLMVAPTKSGGTNHSTPQLRHTHDRPQTCPQGRCRHDVNRCLQHSGRETASVATTRALSLGHSLLVGRHLWGIPTAATDVPQDLVQSHTPRVHGVSQAPDNIFYIPLHRDFLGPTPTILLVYDQGEEGNGPRKDKIQHM